MIELHLEEFVYPKAKTPVLKDLHIQVKQGERVALMGASGSGKSTVLRILMGVEHGAKGQVKIGAKSFDLLRWQNQTKTFGIVTQAPHLLPWKTVLKNISLAVPAQNAEERERLSHTVLTNFGLAHAARLYPHQISQGMAARVSLARTLVLSRPALLLDEPFAALDALSKRKIQDWYSELAATENLTSILVTHDVREAIDLCQRIVVLGKRPTTVLTEIENVSAIKARGGEAIRDLEGHLLKQFVDDSQ